MAGERCKRCHRKLKTPEAIAVGFGSSCYKQMFGKTLRKPSRSTYNSRRTEKKQEISELEGQISVFDIEGEVEQIGL